ncbi:MAG: hypothetical protein ACXU8S_04585 [Phenylobacterium sp.]
MHALRLRTPKRTERMATIGGDLAFWLVVATVMAGVAALMWGTATTAY